MASSWIGTSPDALAIEEAIAYGFLKTVAVMWTCCTTSVGLNTPM